MKTLITGGNGLLGRELLIPKGLKPSRQQLDLMSYQSICKFIENNSIESIIHCAAKVGGVKANNDYPHNFFIENLQINTNILRACDQYKLKNCIFILSTCIFPEYAPLPLKEENIHDGEPHITNFGYAYAKRILEIGARTLYKQHGLKSTCIIPCNLYGKYDNYNLDTGHVIPNLIHKCYIAKQTNTPFVIWGSGEEEREFMFANDFAEILQKIHTHDDLPQNIIVSNEKNYKISDIVNTIVDIFKFTGNIVYTKDKGAGVFKKPTSNTIFRQHFPNFKFTELKQGLETTIEYFINNLDKVKL